MGPSMPHQPALSVVTPCYNEQDGLPHFLERMIAACRDFAGGSYEIILVNDGSRDQTWACIRALALINPGVVGVNLSRNHGHQLAVTAGLTVARGERVLIIDADLQDPPELLGAMMKRIDDGFDVAYGRRRARAGETAVKRGMAHLYYRLLGQLSDIEIPMDTGDFRLMTRQMVERLNAMPEQDRFLRGMVAWLGGRQTAVDFDRDPRFAGTSGYDLKKMLSLALGGLTSFSTAPLRLAAIMTGVGLVVGAGVGLYVLTGLLLGKVVPGWTSLAMIMVMFSTAQLACLAVLSIYVGRIFTQVKQRPLYLINDIVQTEFAVGLATPTGLAPSPETELTRSVA